MFTGIVQGKCKVAHLEKQPNFMKLGIWFNQDLLQGLHLGASVSVNGVCLTVVRIDQNTVYFDVIDESLKRTNLRFLEKDHLVNIERALKVGDEVGGHFLTGHIMGLAQVKEIKKNGGNRELYLQFPTEWMKYFFSKGFIALDGVSLTLVDVDPNGFSVHLIPETIRTTILGEYEIGAHVNVEIDNGTQTIVETVERMMKDKNF